MPDPQQLAQQKAAQEQQIKLEKQATERREREKRLRRERDEAERKRIEKEAKEKREAEQKQKALKDEQDKITKELQELTTTTQKQFNEMINAPFNAETIRNWNGYSDNMQEQREQKLSQLIKYSIPATRANEQWAKDLIVNKNSILEQLNNQFNSTIQAQKAQVNEIAREKQEAEQKRKEAEQKARKEQLERERKEKLAKEKAEREAKEKQEAEQKARLERERKETERNNIKNLAQKFEQSINAYASAIANPNATQQQIETAEKNARDLRNRYRTDHNNLDKNDELYKKYALLATDYEEQVVRQSARETQSLIKDNKPANTVKEKYNEATKYLGIFNRNREDHAQYHTNQAQDLNKLINEIVKKQVDDYTKPKQPSYIPKPIFGGSAIGTMLQQPASPPIEK